MTTPDLMSEVFAMNYCLYAIAAGFIPMFVIITLIGLSGDIRRKSHRPPSHHPGWKNMEDK